MSSRCTVMCVLDGCVTCISRHDPPLARQEILGPAIVCRNRAENLLQLTNISSSLITAPACSRIGFQPSCGPSLWLGRTSAVMKIFDWKWACAIMSRHWLLTRCTITRSIAERSQRIGSRSSGNEKTCGTAGGIGLGWLLNAEWHVQLG